MTKGSSKKYRVVIEEVGIYLKDSFDFNDGKTNDSLLLSQPLGFWPRENLLIPSNVLEELPKICDGIMKYKCDHYPDINPFQMTI